MDRKERNQSGKSDRRPDNTISDSFSASDPPAHTGITGTGGKAAPGKQSSGPVRPPSNEPIDRARSIG